VDEITPSKRAPAPADADQEPTQFDLAPAHEDLLTQDESIDEPYELSPGSMLGEYRIEHKLGEGGMGVVFAAVHSLIGKQAAIKVLKPELCKDASSLERFIDEARAVNQIHHPNIVDIFAFGQTMDGRSYYVMEWLKGKTLRDAIAERHLRLDEVCAIGKHLCRALEAAHEKAIIHRDLKPENIFLVELKDEPPMVKLLDFGIAKLATRNELHIEKTATGQMVGTPMYVAPEQAKGKAIDHRVDIYSLGGIVFEMLTGQPPFVADNAAELIAYHLTTPPRHPIELVPELPKDLDEMVVAMLAKDARMRPPLHELWRVLDETSHWVAGTMTKLHISAEDLAETFDRNKPPAPVVTQHSAVQLPIPAPAISTARPIAALPVPKSPVTQLPDRPETENVKTKLHVVPELRSKWPARLVIIVAIALAGVAAGLAVALVGNQESKAVQHVAAADAAPVIVHLDSSVVSSEIVDAAAAPPTGRIDLVFAGVPPSEVLIDGQPWTKQRDYTLGPHDLVVKRDGAVILQLIVTTAPDKVISYKLDLPPPPRPPRRQRPPPPQGSAGSDDDEGDRKLLRPGEAQP
jgi:serine/threonine protein kinase